MKEDGVIQMKVLENVRQLKIMGVFSVLFMLYMVGVTIGIVVLLKEDSDTFQVIMNRTMTQFDQFEASNTMLNIKDINNNYEHEYRHFVSDTIFTIRKTLVMVDNLVNTLNHSKIEEVVGQMINEVRNLTSNLDHLIKTKALKFDISVPFDG